MNHFVYAPHGRQNSGGDHNWLSSDYMLSVLALDPALTQKRLGDGFYEQRLINEQVVQLTGQRFLGDYSSDDDLRPGIALTAAQVAQLASDTAWPDDKCRGSIGANAAPADGLLAGGFA